MGILNKIKRCKIFNFIQNVQQPSKCPSNFYSKFLSNFWLSYSYKRECRNKSGWKQGNLIL